ncbi:PilZ domain-containing protein [Alkalimarinus coralli]|uniref:PilZ domain-containing protein n=1 Tax=Alkalimarinus coralli TaxID=2935863 RepID=UPI00202B391B|nr:PilZ domain-containing protein [Alkalimarinus coralli]
MEAQSVCRKNTQELTDADFLDSSTKPEETPAAPSVPTKRQHPRRSAKWRVGIKTTQGLHLEGLTVNVSKEGMMISLPCNLALGSKAFIESTVLYRGTQFKLQAVTTVKHSSVSGSEFNIGFHFKTATEITARFLGQYASRKI